MAISIEPNEMKKLGNTLAGKANKGIAWAEKQPDYSKTILAIGAVILAVLLVINAGSIFWMGLIIFVLYLIGVKVLRKKEPPKPIMQKDW